MSGWSSSGASLVAKCTSPAKESVTGAPGPLVGLAGELVAAPGVVGAPAPVRAFGDPLLPVQADTASSADSAAAANQLTGCTDRTPGV